jgi:Uma2 family endonuclease
MTQRVYNAPRSESLRTTRGISYEEFLDSPADNQRLEWVNGEVVVMSPISEDHSRVNGFLYRVISEFVEMHSAGEVFFDPFQMKTGPNLPGRAPDVLFVATKHRSRLRGKYLEGPADLVVEVVSPGYRSTDAIDKLHEYEQGGVPEYWLIDPNQRTAEFFQLTPSGKFAPIPLAPDRIFHSNVLPGLWIRVDWLWQRPLPTLRTVVSQWGTAQ